MTNRAPSPDQIEAADEALFYLDHLNALVGPFNAGFSKAFHFSSASSSSRQDRRRARAASHDSAESGDEDGKIQVALANHSSLWNQAEDFWHVVGWAFNCSIRHPKRWDRWKLWLPFMLDVLEDDLEERLAASRVKAEQGRSPVAASLLAQYLVNVGDGRAGKRRVMRAILADGSKKSLAEFPEVWKNETKDKHPPKDNHIPRTKKLDFDQGDFGDYMDVDMEDDDHVHDTGPQSTPGRSTRKRRNSSTPMSDEESAPPAQSTPEDFGGMDSVLLRQRFMALVCHSLTQVLSTTTNFRLAGQDMRQRRSSLSRCRRHFRHLHRVSTPSAIAHIHSVCPTLFSIPRRAGPSDSQPDSSAPTHFI